MPIIGVAPVPEGAGPNQSVAITAHGLVAGWADRGPLNQYARSSYGSDNSWLTWKNADCSAAALYWLLGAYGQPPGSLDSACSMRAGLRWHEPLLAGSVRVSRAVPRAS